MRMWPWQGGDAMMHMLVAPDGGGGELQTYGAPPAEEELELLRDNADDGLEGHVRYVGAQELLVAVSGKLLVSSRRRWAGRGNDLASACRVLAVEQ